MTAGCPATCPFDEIAVWLWVSPNGYRARPLDKTCGLWLLQTKRIHRRGTHTGSHHPAAPLIVTQACHGCSKLSTVRVWATCSQQQAMPGAAERCLLKLLPGTWFVSCRLWWCRAVLLSLAHFHGHVHGATPTRRTRQPSSCKLEKEHSAHEHQSYLPATALARPVPPEAGPSNQKTVQHGQTQTVAADILVCNLKAPMFAGGRADEAL